MALNIQQQIVINELEENILLLASAGTGKTNTLSLRTAEIVNKGRAKPSEVLCITFTNKACREMGQRMESLLPEYAKYIEIKTFHSFCFDVIKEQAKKRTDIFTDFMIFDEDDCKELLNICINGAYPIVNIQKFIENVKLERAKRNIYSENLAMDYENTINNILINTPGVFKEISTVRGELNSNLLAFLKSKGKDLILSYDKLLQENHGVDFCDLIVKTKELFKDETVVDIFKKRYRYINIDEVQDTSTIEYEIIEKIFGDNNILICGDIFQTIYGWRGSSPEEIFHKFKGKYFPREIVFNTNYRATKYLTESSIHYLKNAFPLEVNSIYKDEIKAESSQTGEKICLKNNEYIRDEAKYIFEEIRALQVNWATFPKICILTRDNNYNVSLSDYLKDVLVREAVNFDFVLVDQFRFFRRQEIKDVIAFLKLTANRYDSLSLKRIVSRLPTGIGDRSLEEINSNQYKKIGISLSDYIDPLVEEGGEKYSLLIKSFEENNIVVFDVESTGVDVTEDEIIQIAAIKINSKGEVIDSFEKFLKNKRSVQTSVHVHGFSDEFLKEKGENKEKVLKEFLKFSTGSIIVGHNVQYDINILSSELERANLGKPTFRAFYDTLDIYRRFHPNLINHKLETLSKLFDTKHKPSHDAMDDIIATGELLTRAIEKDIIPTSLERMACMSKHIKAFKNISNKLNNLFEKAEKLRPFGLVVEIINDFNIKSLYPGEDGKDKISRLRDFYVLVKELDDTTKGNRDALLDIVKITGLSNGDLENLIINRTKKPRIPIITVHQAKGLEFDIVFLAGAQNSTFPSYRAIKENKLEEEKRTFYVAITRAKKKLYITSCRYNRFNRPNTVSSFINYIPKDFIDEK